MDSKYICALLLLVSVTLVYGTGFNRYAYLRNNVKSQKGKFKDLILNYCNILYYITFMQLKWNQVGNLNAEYFLLKCLLYINGCFSFVSENPPKYNFPANTARQRNLAHVVLFQTLMLSSPIDFPQSCLYHHQQVPVRSRNKVTLNCSRDFVAVRPRNWRCPALDHT